MLTRPQVQRYASQSGLRDLAIAETEIVLTYLLELLGERGFLDKLAFKGGTCLRKLFIGSQGRFSTDLDFTALKEHDPEEMIIEMMDRHHWNRSGQSEIRLQISRRETPTLEAQVHAQCEQSYFSQLPFAPRAIGTLALEEIIAEKIRACYQRSKARDIYDLRTFATRPLNQALVRRLVVLKLWQARDAFDPARLMAKFKDSRDFDWDDLGQLVRRTERIDAREITATCVTNFGFLAGLSEDEAKLASDPYCREHALWERLRTELPG